MKTAWLRVISPSIHGYFCSGWAFFIPYLAVYLLYAWLDWPVNSRIVERNGNSLSAPFFETPSLITIYCILHAAHLALAGTAFYLYFKTSPRPKRAIRDAIHAFMPWVLIVMMLWVPGIYMEFPADPWEHFARIFEWASVDRIEQHSSWSKTSYFLAYSLVSLLPLGKAEIGLNLYQTAMGLLLCWNYFLLAQQIGATRRFAFMFATVQAILFGNDVFSFIRYYGISSSIVAQLGAIALIRLAVAVSDQDKLKQTMASPFRIAGSLVTGIIVLPMLLAFNHPQGLGVACLGVTAVTGWRLVAWRPWMIGVLALILLASSWATVQWWPQHPAVAQVFRPAGLISSLQGFALWPGTPAFARVLAILGLPGIVSIAAAVVLLRWNHPAAWLTLTPLVGLSLPVFAIPLASALAQKGTPETEIVAFNRMLFAIPAGLSVLVLMERAMRLPKLAARWLPPIGVSALAIILTVPPGKPCYVRLWQSLAVTPADLRFRHISAGFVTPGENSHTSAAEVVVANPSIAFALRSHGVPSVHEPRRRIMYPNPLPPARAADHILQFSQTQLNAGRCLHLVIPTSKMLYTSSSQSAQLSGHWLPHEAALGHAADVEQFEMALQNVKNARLEQTSDMQFHARACLEAGSH